MSDEQKIPFEAIRYINDMVMVFDEQGQQIPELQGKHAEASVKLQQANLSKCKFYAALYLHSNHKAITKDEFFKVKKTYPYCERNGLHRNAPRIEVCQSCGMAINGEEATTDDWMWVCPNCHHCLTCQRITKREWIKKMGGTTW